MLPVHTPSIVLTSVGQIFSRCIVEPLPLLHLVTAYRPTINTYSLPNKFRLKLNLDKCTFLTSEAKFLGCIVNSKGFKSDSEYVRAIREMKPPKSKKELQSLIGCLVLIKQFLETRLHEQIRYDMFSSHLRAIHQLNKINKPFAWTERADKAFQKIKKLLSSPPVI